MGTVIINIQDNRVGFFITLCIKAFLILFPSILFSQPAYDLKIEKPVAIAPYKIWQKDQVYGFTGMANVTNLGTKTPVNTKLQLDITEINNGVIWSTTELYNGINMPMSEVFSYNQVGKYSGLYTVYQDSVDFNLTNNKVEFTWEVSDSILSQEDIGNQGIGIKCLGWGNIYHIINNTSKDGRQLENKAVQIGLGYNPFLSYSAGNLIIGLYKWNNTNGNNLVENGELIQVGYAQYEYKEGDPSYEIYNLPMFNSNTFEPGAPLEANTTYILLVKFESSIPTDQIEILADQKLDYSLTSLRDSINQQYNYGHQVCYKNGKLQMGTLYGNAVPVIRMVILPEEPNSNVSGIVYLDIECDNVFNNKDEKIIDNLISDKNSGLPISKTNNWGVYFMELDSLGTYEYTPVVGSGMKAYPPSYIIENDSLGKEFLKKDFSVCYTNSFHDLEVILTPYNPPAAGLTNNYDVCIKNKGSYYETAKLIMDFKDPNAATYIDIIGTQGGIITGNTVTWDINNLKYFDEKCFKVTIKLANNTPLGTILTPHLKIVYDSSSLDITPLNNEVEEDQEVAASYDPNDKTVNTKGFNKDQLVSGLELEYVIRFQNTGTAWADLVEIYDTLQNTLDINRFEMVSSSHNYTLTKLGNNILKWRFDNINLPDSASLEEYSHGYIKFRIHTKENLTEQDVIFNSAAIYFDFNTPVFTDTAKTTYLVVTSNYTISKEKLKLSVYPNPVSNTIRLEYTQLFKAACIIELIDPSGKVIDVKTYPHRNPGAFEERINVSSYIPGIYLIRVTTDNYSGEVKVVKQ